MLAPLFVFLKHLYFDNSRPKGWLKFLACFWTAFSFLREWSFPGLSGKGELEAVAKLASVYATLAQDATVVLKLARGCKVHGAGRVTLPTVIARVCVFLHPGKCGQVRSADKRAKRAKVGAKSAL